MGIKIKTTILILAALLIVASILYLERKGAGLSSRNVIIEEVPANTMNKQEKLKKYSLAKEITTPDGFINIDNISIGEFVGKKVVLLDIWTYSCINCQRTLPYLNAWHEKYSDKGLMIIGLHTPEFEFEKKYENVLEAVRKFKIEYPVVLDNDYSTWRAYNNRYWPRKYLIDIDGFVAYDHIGEGGYEETERKIQELLSERSDVLGMDEYISDEVAEPMGAHSIERGQRISPEIYFGSDRNSYLGNGNAGWSGIQSFTVPENPNINTLYFDGEWDIQTEFAKNQVSGAKILFRYNAKNVHFVASAENPINIEIYKDGIKIGEKIVQTAGLYDLVADKEYGEHTLMILIKSPGLQAFTFTFG